ncbi:MAG: HAMP domain-containing histidine kinase [Burkholderiaceae bacterium]|nr:HAMP domain-containing histidine kinase [Burkholderiaceae bacterium]
MTGTASSPRVPTIRTRLANALVAWSLVWGLAVGAAVWLAATSEVDELLDDGLQSAAELLAAIALQPAAAAALTTPPTPGGALDRFAWQVVERDGTVPLRSTRAPATPWRSTPSAGFGDTPDWRLFGLALGADGRMLYAAQTRDERLEARADAALSAVLAALAVGLLGHVWLRSRVRSELEPLQTLSDRLEALDVDAAVQSPEHSLGPAERRELQPVHRAIDALMDRLATRVATERAFSAHAAHALRTPLAGIDAQLAVALRECPAPLTPRLQRVRDAAARLQGVVAALLGLFRTGSALNRSPVDVARLVARLPAAGLQVRVADGLQVQADADLLAAALVNLLDNALRHGAQQVAVTQPRGGSLRLQDDGPGVAAERLAQLQAALDAQAYDGATGLGLMLADRVARAHGGRLRLPDTERGFAVELDLTGAPTQDSPA